MGLALGEGEEGRFSHSRGPDDGEHPTFAVTSVRQQLFDRLHFAVTAEERHWPECRLGPGPRRLPRVEN
jgi:hypothetical protein